MKDVTRRRFLQAVALGTGALASGVTIDPRHALADNGIQASKDGTIFLEGKVVSVSAAEASVTIRERGEALVDIRTSPETRIWKGEVTDLKVLQPEDFVYVRAFPDETDDSLTATKVWANIANLRGIVDTVAQDGFQLRYGRDAEHLIPVRYRSNLEVNGNAGTVPDVHAGQFVHVVGELKRDGTLHATRLWTPKEV